MGGNYLKWLYDCNCKFVPVRDLSADESVNRKMSLDNSHIRHHLILLTLVLHTFFFFLCKGSSLHLLNREPLKLWHHFMTSVATYFTYFFYDTSRPLHYMNRRWTFLVQSTFLFQKNLMWNPILPLTCY